MGKTIPMAPRISVIVPATNRNERTILLLLFLGDALEAWGMTVKRHCYDIKALLISGNIHKIFTKFAKELIILQIKRRVNFY